MIKVTLISNDKNKYIIKVDTNNHKIAKEKALEKIIDLGYEQYQYKILNTEVI